MVEQRVKTGQPEVVLGADRADLRVAIQGPGNVNSRLCGLLVSAARVVVSDNGSGCRARAILARVQIRRQSSALVADEMAGETLSNHRRRGE